MAQRLRCQVEVQIAPAGEDGTDRHDEYAEGLRKASYVENSRTCFEEPREMLCET